MQVHDKHPKVTETVQAKAGNQSSVGTILAEYKSRVQRHFSEEEPLQKKENKTGMPDNLKSGIENFSGYSMDDVKVHYNSSKPAQLRAHAYAQGTDIHIGPGQEKHLPHEAWHVVQQKQGRVKPTMQMKGIDVNDNAGLENEADKIPYMLMKKSLSDGINSKISNPVAQRVLITDVPATKDFSGITDLAIWWAMAAEFNFQKKLPANEPNVANLNPLDYIKSLADFLPVEEPPAQAPSQEVVHQAPEAASAVAASSVQSAPSAASSSGDSAEGGEKIHLAEGDSIRMLAHGYDPKDNLNSIDLSGAPVNVNEIMKNIETAKAAGDDKKVKALYCYMGDNEDHKGLLGGKIGKGPMLAPSMGSVSLDLDSVEKALKNIPEGVNTWSEIITEEGAWNTISDIGALSDLLKQYIAGIKGNGVEHADTNKALSDLLVKVYEVVDKPYNDFAEYLIGKAAATGETDSPLWS